jgi:hypothetical protein
METRVPTGVPTSAPSLTTETLWRSQAIEVEGLLREGFLARSAADIAAETAAGAVLLQSEKAAGLVMYDGAPRSIVAHHTFSNVHVGDAAVPTQGGCAAWRDFWGENGPMDLDLQDRTPVRIGIAQQKRLFNAAVALGPRFYINLPDSSLDEIEEVTNVTQCRNVSAIAQLLSDARQGRVTHWRHGVQECDGSYWRVTACMHDDVPSELALCGSADRSVCEQDICSANGQGAERFQNAWMAPCSQPNIILAGSDGAVNDQNLIGLSSILVTAFVERVRAPLVTAVNVTRVGLRSADVEVVLRRAGNA